MKILKIEIVNNKPKKIDGLLRCKGKITIGKFSEGFYMRLNSWDIEQYKSQWREGLERIKTHKSSCLIADISTWENNGIGMQIYYLYKVDNKILVQYQMYAPSIFEDLLKDPLPFDPFNNEKRYINIPPIELIDEDGNNLEIWEADLDGIVS